MSIFPHIEFEGKVQIADKTRFNCGKSFVVKGGSPATSMLLTPGIGESAVEIYDAEEDEQYLDWAYTEWTCDIDSTNDEFLFQESGVDLIATLSGGNYTLQELIDELETALNSAGALTYSTSLDEDDKITISATGEFTIVDSKNWADIGFWTSSMVTLSNSSSYTGRRVRYLTKKISLEVTTALGSATTDGYLSLYSVDGDHLFSEDSDLLPEEPDILKWLPIGRSSFKNVHRRAQELMLSWLDQQGYTDVFQDKFLIDAVIDKSELTEWSKYLVLRLIFSSIRNAKDDTFEKKAKDYEALEVKARNRAMLRIDVDGDGTLDKGSQEFISVQSISAARR